MLQMLLRHKEVNDLPKDIQLESCGARSQTKSAEHHDAHLNPSTPLPCSWALTVNFLPFNLQHLAQSPAYSKHLLNSF